MASRPLSTSVSPEEYLEFEQTSEIRHEYVDGIVYEMPGESMENNQIAGNIYTELRQHARAQGCRVAFEGIKLWLPRLRRFYYPDVMVLCDPRDTDTHVFEFPCFIAEVISPTTEATDRREKLQAYKDIETLQTYLIVNPTSRSVEVFERASSWQGVRLEGGSLQASCLDLKLSLESIFA